MISDWLKQGRTRIVLAPIALLLVIFMSSGLMISRHVDHVFQSYQDDYLSLSSNLLGEMFDNVVDFHRNRLKVLAVRPELGEGYFVIKIEDNAEPLGKILKHEMDATNASAIWAMDRQEGILFKHGSTDIDPRNELSDLIAFILEHPAIRDPQNQMDAVVHAQLIHKKKAFYLVTLAPLLDVEDIVGVIIKIQPLGGSFLTSLRDDFKKQYLAGSAPIQISLSTQTQVVESTFDSGSHLGLPRDFPKFFSHEINEHSYRNAPVSITSNSAFLILSFDTSELDGLNLVILAIMSGVFLILMGLMTIIILFIVKQISLKHRAQKAYEDLSRSEIKLRTLYDSTRDAVMLLDEKGYFDCNKATLAIFGCASVKEFTQKHPADLSPPLQPCGTDSLSLANQNIARALREGAAQFEWVHSRMDTGSSFFAEVLLSAMELDGRKVLQAVVRDISVRKQAEAALRESDEKLRQAQKMEAIGMLTGGIAHDFNNILASILGFTELALHRYARDESSKLNQFLTNIQTAGYRAKDLVAQMLAFSRGQESSIQQVDALSLIKEVIKMMKATLPSSIVITLNHQEHPRAILSDPVQFHQVIMNLLVNARDAMKGQGRLELAIGCGDEKGEFTCSSCHSRFSSAKMVEILVGDTGCGIEPEIIGKIFQPFFTTKEVGKGSGMGLAVIHGILHNQNAHILVHSEPGRGCAFRLYFPAVRDEKTVCEQGKKDILPGQSLAGRRVLVVDDEMAVVEFLREYLEEMGLTVFPFTSSKMAWTFFQADPQAMDLLITDQTMPEMTGLNLIQAMHGVRKDLPVIMCSGFSRDVDETSADKMGIRFFLGKPIQMPLFTSALLAIFGDEAKDQQ